MPYSEAVIISSRGRRASRPHVARAAPGRCIRRDDWLSLLASGHVESVDVDKCFEEIDRE
jgi:hypothetical protein